MDKNIGAQGTYRPGRGRFYAAYWPGTRAAGSMGPWAVIDGNRSMGAVVRRYWNRYAAESDAAYQNTGAE